MFVIVRITPWRKFHVLIMRGNDQFECSTKSSTFMDMISLDGKQLFEKRVAEYIGKAGVGIEQDTKSFSLDDDF